MDTVLNVKEFGAMGDGKSLDTAAIQAGIDACSGLGGELVFPAGRYISGTLFLKSHVTIRLTSHAVLQSSRYIEHIGSPYQCRYFNETNKNFSFIYGEGLEDIQLLGPGKINGSGIYFFGGREAIQSNGSAQPVGLCLKASKNILLSDLYLEDFGSWATIFQRSKEITVRNVRILNRFSHNNDGLDFDGCSDVRVHGCLIDSDDDSLCIQNSYAQPSKNIIISDCRFHSMCNPIRIGLLSYGDIRNVTIANCHLRSFYFCSGIAIMNSEGGVMEDMAFSNIIMEDTPRPIWLVLNRMRCGEFTPNPLPMTGRLRNLTFQSIRVRCSAAWEEFLQTGNCLGINDIFVDKTGYSQLSSKGRTPLERGFSSILIMGSQDQAIEKISFSDLRITYPGLGTKQQAAYPDLPEMNDLVGSNRLSGTNFPADPRNYPHAFPSYGIYARHINGLNIHDVTLDCDAPDARPAVIISHARDARIRDLTIEALNEEDAIRTKGCENIVLTGLTINKPIKKINGI